MGNFKVGDKVRVISKCKTYGMIGTVKEVYNPVLLGHNITLVVKIDDIDKTCVFNKSSLELINKSEKEEKSKEPEKKKKLGIFSDQDFKFTSDILCVEDVMFVYGHSKEHCLKLHNDDVEYSGADPFRYLLFDGVVYELEEKTVIGKTVREV